jgi:amidase
MSSPSDPSRPTVVSGGSATAPAVDPPPGTPADLATATAARQAELVRSGAVTPSDLVRAALARIDAVDGRLDAFRAVRGERALAEAAALEGRAGAGDEAPLVGVPVAVKDNVEVAGEVAMHGLDRRDAAPARADAAVVRRLRTAGAIVVGQTTMPELALWGHRTDSSAWGATRNPWDRALAPGGSSGGSAVAVAAGMVPVALGSDGGGSIRIPAACCGVFGLKPQRGRIPLAPDDDHWLGLTVLGPIARTVLDAALLLDAVAEGDPGAGTFAAAARRAPGRLRVAVSLATVLPAKPGPAARAAVAETAALLRELGHDVVERDPDYGELRPLFVPRYARGVFEDARRLGGVAGAERATRGMVRLGAAMGRAAERARRAEPRAAARIGAIFEQIDVVLTPVTAAPPPPLAHRAGRSTARVFFGGTPWVCYTIPWNLTGQPAAAVPAGVDEHGLPRAVQLVGRPHAEATLLALAAQIESVRPWAGVRPPAA